MFHKIGLDVVYMPSPNGKNFLVMARDDLSWWVESKAYSCGKTLCADTAVAIFLWKTLCADTAVAIFPWEDVVCRHGCLVIW
jgi:hypothetical protein